MEWISFWSKWYKVKNLFFLFLFFLLQLNSAALGRICIKLVIVMGITWIADVLSFAHGVWFGEIHYIWIVTDLINALQGVFIFIVIGCQPQVHFYYTYTNTKTHLLWNVNFRDVNGCFIYRYRVRLNRYGDRGIYNLEIVVVINIIPVHHRLPHPLITHSLHQMLRFLLKQHAKTISTSWS